MRNECKKCKNGCLIAVGNNGEGVCECICHLLLPNNKRCEHGVPVASKTLCSICVTKNEIPFTPTVEPHNWQKTFDERFNIPHWKATGYNLNYVKDFIRELLQAKEKEVVEKAITMSYGIRTATDADEFRDALKALTEGDKK